MSCGLSVSYVKQLIRAGLLSVIKTKIIKQKLFEVKYVNFKKIYKKNTNILARWKHFCSV